MCRGRGAVVFCPGGRLVFQRSWGGSESEEPAERNLASVSCHRWLLSESARISVWNLSRGRSIVGSYMNDSATVDDLREAVTTLESVAISNKRILGASHPETQKVQNALATAREKLADARASEAKPPP